MKDCAELVVKSALRPCPITGDREIGVLYHQRFLLAEDNPLPNEYDIVWSKRAGFAYADTPAGQDTYDRYYRELSKYEDNKTSTGGGETSSDVARLAKAAGDISQVIANRKARILDIGCANGGLLLALRRLGFESLAGVDPSPACVENVRRKHGIPAELGGLFALPRHAQFLDVVVLSHVLEHVRDLQRAVQAMHGLLSKTGIAYIEVPDASRYRDYVIAPFQDFNTEHINHFNATSLNNLLQSQGFESIKTGTRTILSSPKCPYPVLFGFFRKRESVVGTGVCQSDDSFLSALRDYIARSAARLAEIERVIRPLAQSQTPLLVWGTGQLTTKLLAETSLREANIVAFVDGNPINQGKVLFNRVIQSPERLARLGVNASILVATLLHQEAIASRIRNELGLSNQIIILN